jgi:hypothetical protein
MVCILLSFALSSTLLFAQMENEWAKWDSAEGSMFYLAGGDEITVGGISFLNTGGVYIDPYGMSQNLQNCYDLSVRRGPIFIEARVIDGERKDRYFIFIAEKPAGFPTVVPVKRYLDQVVTSLKKIPETSGRKLAAENSEGVDVRGVVAKLLIIITIAVAGTVFVVVLIYFTARRRRLRHNSMPPKS